MDDVLHPRTEPSLGELFRSLATDTGVLVRKEVELAKTEMTGKAKVAAKDGALVVGGAAAAYFAALLLLATVVLALGTIMPLWAATLIVGVVLAGGAAALAVVGTKKLSRVDAKPRQTIRTIEENRLWLREQTSR